MNELFAPPGEAWQHVSPRLISQRRLLVAVAGVVIGGIATGAAAYALTLLVAVLVALLALALVAVLVVTAGRSARSWRYAEREDDLYIAHGIMFRSMVAVPYGRMQFVDVQSGPLDRLFGIATVRLHTAAPGTSAVIPGLSAEEAARLRDRLTALGEAQAAGL